MKEAKRFIIHASLFLILCFLLALFIQGVIQFPELKEMKEGIKGKDVIYFGDSVVHTVSPNDSDMRDLGVMVSESMSSEVYVFSHGSYTPIMFHEYIAYSSNDLPSVIIVPINLRAFSNNLYSRPIYSFDMEKAYLQGGPIKALSQRFYNLFILSGEKTDKLQEDWLSRPVDLNGVPAGTVNDYFIWLDGDEENFDELMRDWIIYIYGSRITEENPVFISLLKIKEIAEKEGKTVYFYVSPIDHEYSKKYVSEIDDVLEYNIKYLDESLSGKNTRFSDYSTLLPTSYFMYEVMVDEHLNDEGRKILSEKIIDDLGSIGVE